MPRWIRRRRTLARLDRLTQTPRPLQITRAQALLVGVLLLLCLAQKPAYALPISCFSEYAAATNAAWNAYDACVRDTNDDAWYTKMGVMQLCRMNWLSDVFQAEGAYVSCMANFSSLWK